MAELWSKYFQNLKCNRIIETKICKHTVVKFATKVQIWFNTGKNKNWKFETEKLADLGKIFWYGRL